jgi:hypothetical protein
LVVTHDLHNGKISYKLEELIWAKHNTT